jgi:hypothetical protein
MSKMMVTKYYWLVDTDGFALTNIGSLEDVGTVEDAIQLANEAEAGDVVWTEDDVEIRSENGDRL